MVTKKEIDSEVDKLVAYIKTVPLIHSIKSGEFGYDNPVLICLDAVLSINRQYERFVKPRIIDFRENYSSVRTLNDLIELININGREGFCLIWHYKHIERVDLLCRLSLKFIDYKIKIGETDDLSAMKQWARETSVEDFRSFGVSGIGLATFQYLRMMLGVPTVKPDIHITRAIEKALGTKQTMIMSIRLLERASKKLGLDPTFVDHNIWRYYSAKRVN